MSNQQVAGSNHSINFLLFYPKEYTEVFFQNNNQLRPVSILNHTVDAESAHSWLVKNF